jgi:hypothetical protein
MLLLSGSDVVRVTYISDLVHLATRVFWDCFSGVILGVGLLDLDFRAYLGFLPELCIFFFLCGFPANCCVPLRTFYP